jgi:outer membrane lipoprotein-sorting protein
MMIKKVIVMLIMINGFLFADEAAEILREVKKKYENVTNVRIQFTQIDIFKLSGIRSESKGTMYFGSGDNFRLESDQRTIVTDGVKIWSYAPLNKQVVIDYAQKNSRSILPRELLFTYDERYYANLIGKAEEDGKQYYEIKLVPKPNFKSAIESMKIWVRVDSYMVEKILYVDLNRNEKIYLVEEFEQLTSVSDDLFTFVPPAETKIIDLTGRND